METMFYFGIATGAAMMFCLMAAYHWLASDEIQREAHEAGYKLGWHSGFSWSNGIIKDAEKFGISYNPSAEV